MESENETITVTINVFSGRPNPQLVLEGTAASKLAGLVKNTINKEAVHPLPPPKLWAFNGFLVQVPSQLAAAAGLPTEFSVRQGVFTQQEDRRETHWRDMGEVEQFLMDQAYEQGYGDLIDEFMTGEHKPPEETPNENNV